MLSYVSRLGSEEWKLSTYCLEHNILELMKPLP